MDEGRGAGSLTGAAACAGLDFISKREDFVAMSCPPRWTLRMHTAGIDAAEGERLRPVHSRDHKIREAFRMVNCYRDTVCALNVIHPWALWPTAYSSVSFSTNSVIRSYRASMSVSSFICARARTRLCSGDLTLK